MFIGRDNHNRGFTLLEIIIAVAILATMAMSIYRFVQSNLVAIRVSSDVIAADAQLAVDLIDRMQTLLRAERGQHIAVGQAARVREQVADREAEHEF